MTAEPVAHVLRGLTAEGFARSFDVSRETIRRLETHIQLLIRWTRSINLVAPATLADVWTRHVADSAQLFTLAPDHARTWIDLGSGSGFPGLVVAALAAEKRPRLRVRLIESDTRKTVFLAQAARAMGLAVEVDARRVEALPPEPHDVVSARALAPLPQLCALAARFSEPGTVLLFPKGRQAESELTAAARDWHIDCERIPSRTDPGASILKIRELKPRK